MADAVEENGRNRALLGPGTWQDARAAYVADLDNDPDGPDAFVGWLHRAIEDHVAQAGGQAPQLQIPARRGRTAGRGRTGTTRCGRPPAPRSRTPSLADRLVGTVLSRSTFVHEAVTVAVDQARTRAGGSLTPVVGRLPNRPPRRCT